MHDVSIETTSNAILSALGPEERERLAPHLQHHDTQLGEVFFEPGDPIDYVYFPENSMLSIVGRTIRGGSAEIGVIGREGVVGVNLLLGAPRAINAIMVQLTDGGFRLPAAEALKEFDRCGPFHKSTLKFVHYLMMQISQTAVCNVLHGLEERLAKWLLMCRDRSSGDTLHLTQEFLSLMLGSTRASVTLAAISLQDLGYISYKRGAIKVVDRQGMIDFACDCYKVVQIGIAQND